MNHDLDRPQYLKRRWGTYQKISDMLHFVEHHPEYMDQFGRTTHTLRQFSETLRRWIAAGRPDPEELLEDAGRVEADSWCSWRDCMLMIQINEWLTANNPSESISSSNAVVTNGRKD